MTYPLPSAFAYLDELLAALLAATWPAELAPQSATVGPLNPGALSFPALAVIATRGGEDGGDSGGYDAQDTVEISYVMPLSLESPSETFRQLLAAHEVLRTALAAYHPEIADSWGIRRIDGWQVRFTPDRFEEGQPVSWLQELVITVEVDRYVEAVES